MLDSLALAIPGARKKMIPFASHDMFEAVPVLFSELVLALLGD